MLKSQSQQYVPGHTLFVDTRGDETNQTRTWLFTTSPASHCVSPLPFAAGPGHWEILSLFLSPSKQTAQAGFPPQLGLTCATFLS